MKDNQPVIVAQKINADVDKIWEALTNKAVMVKWYFDNIPAFEPVVGFKTKFPVVSEDRTFTHIWEILEVVPKEKIVYAWTFTEYPGYGKVTFLIETSDDGQEVTVVDEVIDPFPDDIPEFERDSCQGGWEYFIQGRLKGFLDQE